MKIRLGPACAGGRTRWTVTPCRRYASATASACSRIRRRSTLADIRWPPGASPARSRLSGGRASTTSRSGATSDR